MRRLAAVAAVLLAACLGTGPAAAAGLTVTTAADEFDLSGAGAGCSLREAVQAANTNAAFGGCPAGELVPQDVITLEDVTHPISRTGADEEANATGDLDLLAPGGGTRIQGAGPGRPTIDGVQADRIFDVHGGGDVELARLRLFHGSTDLLAPLPEEEQVGGAVRVEAGSLDLADSVVEQNVATEGSALALLSAGPHSVDGSALTGNFGVNLGAIHSLGPLTVTRTSITGNNGGGVNVEAGPAGDLTVAETTIAGNLPADAGVGAITAEGDVSVTNSTIHNNIGGFVGALTTPGDVTVSFSTITENGAPEDVSNNAAGGIDSFTANSVVLEGVILAGNFNGLNPSNCNDTGGVTETGPNLDDQDSCGLAPPSLLNTDPQLGSLASNGGPTQTRGLYPGSPALDAAPACGVPFDQRGTPRTDAACDLGGFEGTVPRPVVTPPAEQPKPAGRVRCKARKPKCCSKRQRKRGRPSWCRRDKKPARTRAVGAREVIGRSVQGRPIVATRIGDPDGDRVALVAGVIHGDERAGLRVIAELKRSWSDVEGVQLWLLKTLNPDGQRAGMRKNAHGVDLNRNFPSDWRPSGDRSGGYYPGPGPASEPETRAAMRFIERIKPDVSVWYHQPWGSVLACRGRPAIAARYAELAGMRTSCRGRGLPGTAIGWEKETLPGATAFVVEFSGGAISSRTARRHARAAAIIARDG